MRFAVIGAGAIGAFVGAVLARSGEDVTLVARGPHLRAIQERGVRVCGAIGDFEARMPATEQVESVGVVDVVLLTLKAHSLGEMAPRLRSITGPDTTIVSTQNGMPWWYFYHHGGHWDGTHLESCDPGGVISRNIDPARVIGCIVYPSTVVVEPGVVKHIEGTRFSIGEPDGSKTQRSRRIADSFIRAGLRCPIRTDIRHEIWVKLMGSVAFNPISALTRATLAEIVRCSHTRRIAAEIMTEAEAVAKGLGIDLGVTVEQRLAGAEKVGDHKTSMLQDVEAGRPFELDAIAGAVVELGDKMGLLMPYSRAIYGCTKLLETRVTGTHKIHDSRRTGDGNVKPMTEAEESA
jgi:2-dehydropantoate 2-reductase